MELYLDMMLTFFKIGAFTFGGGYVMIPLIEHICVEEKKWITHEEMMDVIVVAESTPGPNAINCATYVGYSQKGMPGAIATTLAAVFPSFLIIFLISQFLDNFLEITIIANAFKGIKAAVAILIFDAAVKMLKKMKRTTQNKIVLCFCTALMFAVNLFSWNFSSISLMILIDIFSLAMFVIHERKGGTAK